MIRKYNRNRICDYCGCEFEGYPGKPRGKHTFCGQSCRLSAMAERNRTTQRVNKKGGLTFEERTKIRNSRLKEDSESYAKLYGRHEHRVVMEGILGRPLRSDEIVHHINHIKRDNRPGNLALMTQSEHIRLHLREGGGHLHGSKIT